LHYLTFKEKKS